MYAQIKPKKLSLIKFERNLTILKMEKHAVVR